MIIIHANTIEEFKQIQKERIQKWIDDNFVAGAVTWEYQGSSAIKITDKTGDSMIISLDEVN